MNEPARLQMIVERVAPAGHLVWKRRLRGGLGTRMDRLRIQDAAGRQQSVVLRRYVLGRSNSTAEYATTEFRILDFVHTAGIAAPRALALDADGVAFGTPAMVLSYLPGRSFFLPLDVIRWTDRLAAALASVHAVTPASHDLDWLPGDPATDFTAEVAQRRSQLSDVPEIGRKAFARVDKMAAGIEWQCCLIHDDFWPGNTVWYRGRLAGIIDWGEAKRGDPRGDVAQCRADLVISHGLETADAFLSAYERHTRVPLAQMAFFDLLRGVRALVYYRQWLRGYHDAGLTYLTSERAEERLCAYLEQAIRST